MSPEAYVEMAQVQQRHWWFVGRRHLLREQISRLHLPADAQILEIGSGTGANLAMLAEFGRVTGLEMNPQAIALAQALQELPSDSVSMRQGRCPDDLGSLPQFDLICLFDVLEHIEDDRLSLATVTRLLKPGGSLLVTVPAYRWLWGPHDVHLHHVRRYNRRSLQGVCQKAGLRVARISHFNTFLFPLAAARRLAEKLLGSDAAGTSIPVAPVNAFLGRIFASEQYVLRHLSLPFGLSLVAVAEAAVPSHAN